MKQDSSKKQSSESKSASADGESLVVTAFNANRAIHAVIKNLEQAHTIKRNMQRAAWRQVYDALWQGVSAMNKQAMKHPDLFDFAAEACYWPVIKSPGKGFAENEPTEWELFKKLRIGECAEFYVAGTRWAPTDPIGIEALILWHRVFNGRLFDQPLDNDDSPEAREAASRFRKKAKRLRPFKRLGAWKDWCTLAKEVFEKRWNDTHEGPRLAALVRAKSKQSPGRKKAHLWSMIEDKFRSMAGDNKKSSL